MKSLQLFWISGCLILLTLGFTPAGLIQAQSTFTAADTSQIMSSLQRAEAIEMQDPEKALGEYRNALNRSQKTGFTKGYFESMRLITYLLDVLGRHEESQKIASEALAKALQDTSERYKSLAHFALAQSSKNQSKNEQAIQHFKLAAPYMLSHPNKKKAAALYQNLGLIYEAEKLYPRAIEYYNRALHFDQIAKSSNQELSMDYHSLASVYFKQGQLKQAMTYFRKAISLLDSTKDLHYLTDVYGNVANLYKDQAKFDSSLFFYTKALRLNQQLHSPNQEMHLLAGLASTYNETGQYKKAKTLLDKAYGMAQKNHSSLTEFRNIYREYANAALGLNDYKGAIPWFKLYMDTKDSLASIEAKTLLEEYEVKLREAEAGQKIAEKQQRIDRLEQDRERQNLWILVASLVAVLIIGGLILGYLYSYQRQKNAQNAMLAATREHELAVVQSELLGQQKERLRISKELHDDLGASLTAIGLLSEVVKTRMKDHTPQEVEKISSISADMVTTMNEIIWSLNTKNDSLNGLIAYTRAYASEFIDNTDLNLKTQVAESPKEIAIRGTDRRNIFLTVKEALHNVVKHAKATQVSLMIQPENRQLVIQVFDNGHGFTPNQKSKIRNGLGNMQNRMAESGGDCEISSSETGTCVRITFPYPLSPLPKILQT